MACFFTPFCFAAKKRAPRNTRCTPKCLLESSSDNCHLVDFFRIAAAGQVVNWCVETLKNWTKCLKAAQTLCNLITDVARIDIWEDKGVCMTCNSRALTLCFCNHGGECSVKLKFTINCECRSCFFYLRGLHYASYQPSRPCRSPAWSRTALQHVDRYRRF